MSISESQVKTLGADAIRVYEQIRRFAAENSSGTITNFLATQATLQNDAIIGDYVPELLARITSTRSRIDGAIRESAAALDSVLRMYAQVLGNVPEVDAQSILSRLYDDYIANSKRITSRGFVFGSVSNVGSPVGNGSIYRCNLDENGFVLENQHADAKNARCLSDASSGAAGRNEEIFEVRGSQASRDALALAGSGARVQVAGLSARASSQLIQNPSFSTVGGTAAVPTSIPGWTSSITVNASNYQYLDGSVGGTVNPSVQGSIIYRDFPGDSTPYALQCLNTAAWSLSQSLEIQRPSLSPGVPYFLSVAFKKSSSGTDGSLTLSIGNSSTAIADLTLSPFNNTNWNVLVLGDTRGAPGKKNWYKNFDTSNLTLTIARAAGTTGTITIDDVIFAPMASFDGSWYVFLGGSTQWQRYDQYTWTDTENATNTAQIQNWLWRSYGRYLPAVLASPNVVSAALAGAGAGSVTNGAHTWYCTSVDASGIESGIGTGQTATVANNAVNGKVNVVLPSPTGAVTLKLYRSLTGTVTPAFLVNSNNSPGATILDNFSDGSLSTSPPSGVSWSEP